VAAVLSVVVVLDELPQPAMRPSSMAALSRPAKMRFVMEWFLLI
jgi:hypothetical protein